MFFPRLDREGRATYRGVQLLGNRDHDAVVSLRWLKLWHRTNSAHIK